MMVVPFKTRAYTFAVTIESHKEPFKFWFAICTFQPISLFPIMFRLSGIFYAGFVSRPALNHADTPRHFLRPKENKTIKTKRFTPHVHVSARNRTLFLRDFSSFLFVSSLRGVRKSLPPC